MKKRLNRKEKEEKAIVDLINKMFEIAGHNVTYDDIKDRQDDWFTDWTMTLEQNEEWKKWGKTYLMKNFRVPAKRAEKEMFWISMNWGLKFEDLIKE